jgi:magnesium transporter
MNAWYNSYMILRHALGKITWVDIESPTAEELEGILREFHIDARVGDEMVEPTPYPLFIPFQDYLYLVLHFPTALAEGGTKNQEIDFIVGKDFIVTGRYEVIDPLHNLHKVFEAEELLGLPRGLSAPVFLERVFRRLYGALGHEVEQAAGKLDRIEHDIFSGRERATVGAISEVGRILLRFETALTRHEEPLSAFAEELSTTHFFGKAFREHAVHIRAERDHAANLIASYRAVASELRNTNDSLLSTSQNEVMRTLTVVTFIAFPLSLIAAIFSMNVPTTPIVNDPNAFWIILGGMFGIVSFITWLVIRRGWL